MNKHEKHYCVIKIFIWNIYRLKWLSTCKSSVEISSAKRVDNGWNVIREVVWAPSQPSRCASDSFHSSPLVIRLLQTCGLNYTSFCHLLWEIKEHWCYIHTPISSLVDRYYIKSTNQITLDWLLGLEWDYIPIPISQTVDV